MLGGKWNANSGSEGRKMGRAEWREEGTIKRRRFGENPPAANLGPPARRHARKRRRRRGRTFLIYSDKVVLSFVRSFLSPFVCHAPLSDRTETKFLGKTFRLLYVHPSNSEGANGANISSTLTEYLPPVRRSLPSSSPRPRPTD